MDADNTSVILYGIDDIRLEQRPIRNPGRNEVLISVQKVGICGSDVHYWKNGRINDFIVKAPMVLGHEPSGIIAKVGEGVTNLKAGDRVVIEPGVACLMCDFCKTGSYNLCPDMAFCATPPFDGTLCHYYVHHAAFCHKIPDHVSLEEAAVVEPLAVAIHGNRRGGVGFGKAVLITGAGPIGLLNAIVAKAMGATKVCVTDIVQNRLDVAKNLGADFTVLCTSKDPKATAEKVVQTMGCQPDVTLECSGAEFSIQLALMVTKSKGVVTLIGLGAPMLTVPLTDSAVREIQIVGVFRYANCHPLAIEMIASGKVDVKPLITHRFELKDAIQAFEVARTGQGGAIKVMINCSNKSS